MTDKPLDNRKKSPAGTWTTPVSSDSIVADTVSLDQIAIDGKNIYWIEGRASEKGRCVLVGDVGNLPDRSCEDLTSSAFNVRSRVHEYGGGAYSVQDGVVYFSNLVDQRIYRFTLTGPAPCETPAEMIPVALTEPADHGKLRYADGFIDRRLNRMIAVREDHRNDNREAFNTLVQIDLSGQRPATILAQGHDFYAAPCLSPDGRQLAWIAWDHPNMPWDGTTLWVATVNEDGSLSTPQKIAGGLDESIFQPSWSPAGKLYFVSDRSGWWNLYRLENHAVHAVYPLEAEFGRPLWNLGTCTYGFDGADSLVCSYVQNGQWQIARIDIPSSTASLIDLPFHSISSLKIGDGFAAFIGGGPTTPDAIVRLDLRSLEWTVLRRSVAIEIDRNYLSIPETIAFPTTGSETSHAFFYAPANADFCCQNTEAPPLLVISHGGPTASANTTLNLSIQYWTSRGFGVVDVNYRGSTGYGRAYRERLNGQWGIVDVDDAIAASRFLVTRGDVDGDRIAIRGRSAGGYTTLAALTFHNYFKAGASYYGVSDLEALARDCHKFESRYLDNLIGPYPAKRDTYLARSPLNFIDCLRVPLILFQGMQDRVVPPNQSKAMFDALEAKNLPVAYITFETEQHGFRESANIKHALEAELYFYAKIFKFRGTQTLPPTDIKNLI
jgi:dipeptidyl aminopeptidase/acylaminoacyl peptidase